MEQYETSEPSTPPNSPQTSQDCSHLDDYQTTATTSSEIAQETQPLRVRFSKSDRPPVASTSAQSSREDEEIIPAHMPQQHIRANPFRKLRTIRDPTVYENIVKVINTKIQKQVASGQFVSSQEPWTTCLDTSGNKMMGLLYAGTNSRNPSAEDIYSVDSRALRLSYPVTVGGFGGFKFLVRKNCRICRKLMNIYFFYNNNNGPFLRDDARQDKNRIRPYWENRILKLVHEDCVHSTVNEHDFFYKLIERKLSFRQWWILRRPLLMISEIILVTTFVLGVSAALLYIIINNMMTNFPMVTLWFFGAVSVIFVIYKKTRSVARSVKECWQACCNNYQEIKFELWKGSDSIFEDIDISI